MKKQLLILLTLCTSIIGYSQTVGDIFVENFITYEVTTISPNTVEVTGYNTAGGTAVIISETVINNSITYSVTSIGDFAFVNKLITSVSIGNNIVNIGLLAFNNNLLSSVTIPDSVTALGNQSFSFNPLTDVFSESITPPTIITGGNNDTFGANRSGIHLHIPAGTMGAYVTDTGALWTGFNPVTEDALSVSDFELTNAIKVITTTDGIKVTHSNTIRLQNYTIYSISGAKVATGNKNEIPTNYLPSGIYVLKLDFDKGTFVKKIVVN